MLVKTLFLAFSLVSTSGIVNACCGGEPCVVSGPCMCCCNTIPDQEEETEQHYQNFIKDNPSLANPDHIPGHFDPLEKSQK